MSRTECDAIKPLISAALDGDLDEQEFVQLSEHLASCADCRRIHHDYSHLRDGLRSEERPLPPPQLARNIWKETVEKPPPPAIVRLASRTGVRLGMSTMAASVVALLVAVLFLAHGYDQRTLPVVAASQPVQGSTQDWPISRPIEIEFSKQMNHDSVRDNLIIRPSSEQDRLPTSWSGNTLIIGRSEDHSVLLRPETDYSINILEHAEDRHGNTLGDFWVLQFRTGQPEVAIATPSPDSNESSPAEDRDPASSTEWMFGQGDNDDGRDDDESVEAANDDESTEQESTESSASELQQSSSDQSDQNTSSESAPTAEPEPTQPESTPEPAPTATPRPDPTPEPTPTNPPAPTPTPEPYAVRGALGEVYWGKRDVQDALGNPVQQSRSFLASEQEFQRGFMFRQFYQDRNAIFIFVNGGIVSTRNNNYDPGVHNYPVEEKGDGLYQPGGYFGKVWAEEGSLADQIGYAVRREPVENVDAEIQQFDRGMLLYSRGSVYVIHSDGSWEVHVVRTNSDGGFQGDDSESESNQNQDNRDQSESSEPGTPEQVRDPESGNSPNQYEDDEPPDASLSSEDDS